MSTIKNHLSRPRTGWHAMLIVVRGRLAWAGVSQNLIQNLPTRTACELKFPRNLPMSARRARIFRKICLQATAYAGVCMIQLLRPRALSVTCQAHRSSCPFCAAIPNKACGRDSVTLVKSNNELSRAKCSQRGGTSPMAPLAPLSSTSTRQARTRHHYRSGRQHLLTAKQASTATMIYHGH